MFHCMFYFTCDRSFTSRYEFLMAVHTLVYRYTRARMVILSVEARPQTVALSGSSMAPGAEEEAM